MTLSCLSTVCFNKETLNYGVDLNVRIGFELGNGSSISFWKDRWATVNPFAKSFPVAYKFAANKNTSLQEMIISTTGDGIVEWKWNFRSPRERAVNLRVQQEVQDIKEIVKDIKLQSKRDKWGWETANSLEDSVRMVREELDGSLAKKLAHPTSIAKQFSVCCGWDPAKANMFFWRAVLGRIATNDQLYKRGIRNVEQCCVLCKEEQESAHHLLSSCSLVSQLWKDIGL